MPVPDQPEWVVHTVRSGQLGSLTVTDVPAPGDQSTPAPEPAPQPAPEPTPPQPVITACTVATRAELPAVRVLRDSFHAHHPGSRFAALIVDALPDDPEPDQLTPLDLGLTPDDLARLATGCTAAQLRAVLRPRLLHALVNRTDHPVLHLDPWVRLLDPVAAQVTAAVAASPLVLLPRVLRPLPDDGLRPAPDELLQHGLYDPGFLALGKGALPFLASWTDHAHRAPESADDFLESAPALVDHHVLRDARLGLSVWNAGQRPLHRDTTGRLTVLGEPLRTVHFTGFDPQRPWLLSADFADRPRTLLSEHPLLAELVTEYRADLVRAGHSMQLADYRYATVAGLTIPDALRAEHHTAGQHADRDGTPPPPPAFHPDGPDAFVEWACEPVANIPGSTRWAAALWRSDPWLRRQFPDPFDTDADDFRDWCAGPGVTGGRLPAAAVPGPRTDEPGLLPQLGVSVVGTGRQAELLLAAARASGLPTSSQPSYPVVLRVGHPGPIPADRYLVATDLDLTSPDDHPDAAELWVASDTTRAAVTRDGGRPVRVLPLPVADLDPRTPEDRATARAALDLPDTAVVFGATAEYTADTTTERAGNPLGAVSAFLTAFPDRADVLLLVQVTGARAHPEGAERLRLATSADPRIHLVEDPSAETAATLRDAADCVISLHRGGAGDRVALRLADAGARGIPVLASDHGAAAELFGRSGAVLVPCHGGGAEPDVPAAARLLRSIADDLDSAARIGATGRDNLRATRSVARIADQLRERVEHAYRTWRARRAAAHQPPPADPLRPLQAAKHALLRRPDPDVASRTPMAPTLRKAVLRVLSHYDNHMHEVLTTLVDGVERTADELVRRQDQLGSGTGGAELDVLRAQTEHLAEQHGHLAEQLVGVDDSVVRARADLAAQGRRLAEAEDAVVGEAAKRTRQVDALAQRIDKLTTALDRTLDRIDALESKVVDVLRDRDSRLDAGVRAANQAQQTADALRRVVVREHERHSPPVDGVRSSLVLSDAGLLRLPADDALMLPLLSSNGVWEPELSELIDSLVEPDGVFLDVGAYVGYHTIRVLSRLGTSGAVVAVEPSPEACALLRQNVEVNVPAPIARRLAVVEAAAWDSPGSLPAQPALTGGLTVTRPAEPDPAVTESGDSATPEVRVTRLDRELDDLPALAGMRLSVVRVDVPGRGHRALAGLVRLLRRDRPHVLLEFSAAATSAFGDDPVTVLREFRVWGYELVPLGSRTPTAPEDVVESLAGGRAVTLWLRPKVKPAPIALPEAPPALRQVADQPI